MRTLVIGGTGFIGTPTVRELLDAGHTVAVYHRGQTSSDLPVEHIEGDVHSIEDCADRFAAFAPDLVIDFLLASGEQAERRTRLFQGSRILAISSMDVYRVCGVTQGTESAAIDNTHLREDSPLRENLDLYGPDVLSQLRHRLPWLGDSYDKIPVEQAVLAAGGIVVRLPMVYGPGDPNHRYWPTLKRMLDRRPFILLEDGFARWRAPRGYVENVAHGIALLATRPDATGIYNLSDETTYSELRWTEKLAVAAIWSGRLVIVTKERIPSKLQKPLNYEQHWIPDTSRIRREVGYREKIETREALRRLVAWERTNGPAELDLEEEYLLEEEALVT